MSVASVMQRAWVRPGVIWKLFAPPPLMPSGTGGRLFGSHGRIDASSNSGAGEAAGSAGAAGFSACGFVSWGDWITGGSFSGTVAGTLGGAAVNGRGSAAVIDPVTIGTAK